MEFQNGVKELLSEVVVITEEEETQTRILPLDTATQRS